MRLSMLGVRLPQPVEASAAAIYKIGAANNRIRRLMILAVAFAGIMTMAFPIRANAQQTDAGRNPSVPVMFGASFQDKTGAATASTDENTTEQLKTLPVGKRVFKTLAEVEGDKIEPGSKVDVLLVTIGGEGAHVERVLRNATVYSVGPVQDDGKSKAVDGDAAETKGLYPVRTVGLIAGSTELETLRLADSQGVIRLREAKVEEQRNVLGQVMHNFVANLFQPLLLFFFMGFSVPLLKVPFEFPKALYQSLTIYLLVAIGWHGGELMAQQSSEALAVAGGMVVVGFLANSIIGYSATKFLEWFTPMRKIDAVTVGAYYGSDSAGTFVTCLGILATLNILHDSYMPVMLAVMEIPGCLVGLFLVSRLRRRGMDHLGNMPGEPDYDASHRGQDLASGDAHGSGTAGEPAHADAHGSIFSLKIAHEVFLNPGLFLLFGGILIGFISGLQAHTDPHIVEGPNNLFVFIFKGALCLFLLEMGMTACKRLRDLKTAGIGFILFGILAPNVFATFGMLALHGYSMAIHHSFYLGTYALFAVLCGAASYIAVPAIQRIAIPEASPTLPLAASLGLTFTWNVTLGIPIYIEIANAIMKAMPVA